MVNYYLVFTLLQYVLHQAADYFQCCIFHNNFTDILRQRSQEEVVLKHAISILKRSGCFDYARKQLRSIRREILEEVNKLERNLLMDEFINDYLDIPVNFEDIAWEIS